MSDRTYQIVLCVTGDSQKNLNQNVETLQQKLSALDIPFEEIGDEEALVQLLMRRYEDDESTVRQWLAEKDSVYRIVDDVIRGFRETPPDNKVSRWRKFHAGLPGWLRSLLPPYKYTLIWYRGWPSAEQQRMIERSRELERQDFERR